MSYLDALSSIICDTFEKEVPRSSGKAMVITFRSKVDYEREEGYRFVDLVLYRKTNYTRVCYRHRWDVISLEDMSYNVISGEDEIKPGKDYKQGDSEWVLKADHDSAWRYDGVHRFLIEQELNITGLDNVGGGWYKIITPDFEYELPCYRP